MAGDAGTMTSATAPSDQQQPTPSSSAGTDAGPGRPAADGIGTGQPEARPAAVRTRRATGRSARADGDERHDEQRDDERRGTPTRNGRRR